MACETKEDQLVNVKNEPLCPSPSELECVVSCENTVNSVSDSSEQTMDIGNTIPAGRWGMSWILIGLVVFNPGTFLITFMISWQLGHFDPILPLISDTAALQPETGIFAELLNIGALFMALTIYVRYRQLAEYLSTRESPHPVRVNKASFGIGIIVVFGMTVVANFPTRSSFLLTRMLHKVGAIMTFGLGCVYLWMQVALSFVARLQLSSAFVHYVRVVLAFIATVTSATTSIIEQTDLNDILVLERVSGAAQWTLLTSIMLFLLTHFHEFRHITIKPAVTVVDRRTFTDK